MPGMILGENAVVKTKSGKVELTTSYGDIYRLCGKSEFCLEWTLAGLAPVFYGNVYVENSPNNTVYGGGKYRTSCWIPNPGPRPTGYTIQRVTACEDQYFTFGTPISVIEYDENGTEFEIVKLNAYQKCTLKFDFSKSMRKRYEVVKVETLTSKDVASLYETYLNPDLWVDHSYDSGNLTQVL